MFCPSGGVILAVIEGVGISINRAMSEGFKPGDEFINPTYMHSSAVTVLMVVSGLDSRDAVDSHLPNLHVNISVCIIIHTHVYFHDRSSRCKIFRVTTSVKSECVQVAF